MTDIKVDPSWSLLRLRAELKRTCAYLAAAQERKYGETDHGIERAATYRADLEDAIKRKERTV